MAKILGLDLGTNSIGWSIRVTDLFERESFYNQFQKDKSEKKSENPDSKELNFSNEIVDYGVVIFKKGVGELKKQEFSLAADRRTHRGKRRLYNAKRYRKWELLKVLIENGMCPLSETELRLWSSGNWEEMNGKWKNLGRVYPINNEAFQQWLAFDPTIFGDKGQSEKGKSIRKNPYDLRCELIEDEENNDYLKKLKIGRAIYHLAQRRGFKSNRKSGQSTYAKNEDIERIKAENPDFQIGFLAKEKIDKGERFRSSGVIQRRYFEEEFFAICNTQKLPKELEERLYKAIYFIRPMPSQKGLVGNCTLEKGKHRIPISHPKFEEFRALQFINNIKWREKDTKEFVEIPISLKKRIFEELFFKRMSSGKNKGKVNGDNYFKFDEIIKNYSENETYEFNYKNLPNVSTCPTIASLMNVFDNDWTEKFIQEEDAYGINWDGLILKYKTQDHKNLGKRLKRKIVKGKVTYTVVPLKEEKILKIDEIWHLLFDYLQTKDKQEDLVKFCKSTLGFDEEKALAFADIDIPQGYGYLSYKAISKILTFLQSGYIYSDAVLFANLKKVLGNQFDEKKEDAKKLIAKIIKEIGQTKEKLNIVNGLIQKYFAEAEAARAKGADDTIKELAWKDTLNRLKSYFGKVDWDKKPEASREKITQEVFDLYLKFLNGEQTKEEKASAKDNRVPEIDYYKLPRLDEAIKRSLKDSFNISDRVLKYLYHPSDIEMYPVSKTEICEYCGKYISINKNKPIKENDKCKCGEINQNSIRLLESPQPPSKGWKNPMAMRTLHELRHLLNYLLKIRKIDKDTKIVVEMARELNTKNYRKAYSDWTKDRDNEKKEFKQKILELSGITEPSIDDYNKFRSAVEQIMTFELSGNKTSSFQQKYTDFIDSFLRTIKIYEKSKDELMSDEYYDYLMYLILNREEFRKMLNYKISNTNKWQTQLISTSLNFDKKRKELSEMLAKYLLWKQQKFQCFYTGQQISLTQLFSNNYQIEHTIPRSISFDSELKNLTVCDAIYNNQVKNNRFPTECPNYYEDIECQTVKGLIKCTPIKDRVDLFILPKVKELHTRIKNLEAINKGLEDEKKNANIRLRHYLKFEIGYWEKKLSTFTVKKDEWRDSWKNSQLVDTQIISKYARIYLKTVFEKVDVQKGTVTNIFKKLYLIKGDEQKDRSKHSHHAQDAAILTLIPGSAKREAILEKYYLSEEKNEPKFRTKPYEDFHASHIHDIEDNVIINHISHDKTLTATIKNIRNRGEKTGKVAKGDSIRGQLHEETYLGAIKPNVYNEKGKAIKDDNTGKYLKKQLNGEDVVWVVQRKKIEEIDIEAIIDEGLKKLIKEQLANGVKITDVKDFAGKTIRHIRYKKFSPSYEKTIKVKLHTHTSKYEHKSLYLANNETNYLCLLYKGEDKTGQEIRAFRFVSLFEFSKIEHQQIELILKNPEYNLFVKIIRTNEYKLDLTNILKAGQKVILYKDSLEEIDKYNISDLRKKIYQIYKFNNSGSDYIFLQNIIEARNDEDLKKAGYRPNGDTEFIPTQYQPRLKLTADKLNCLFESIDFEIKPDGTVIFK